MARILVTDDEPQIRRVLRAYLEADGFEVTEAGTGTEALDLALGSADETAGAEKAAGPGSAPDLVLLDVGLPDVDGLEVLRRLRLHSDVPVILVTARAEEVDTLVGLAVGADDYVTKPFSPREVVARAQTVLRRVRPRPAHPARPGDGPGGTAATPDKDACSVRSFPGVSIDADRREVRVDGELVVLTALEFDLLSALADSPGRVYSRAQLLEKVWGYDFYGDERVVDVHIRNIRRVLGDDAVSPRFVGTVRRVGYKFLPEPG
ncbi:MAG TPA: response regulator transcription factor [Dermatophilaceae bacterium]|nr:response regulator transcription factor [Dermatophilaceae bacterium]